jgi:hypothetical protein
LLDHDAIPYILDVSLSTTPVRLGPAPYREGQIEILGTLGDRTLRGEREDWAAHLGLTQVLSKNALIETGLGLPAARDFSKTPTRWWRSPSSIPSNNSGHLRVVLSGRCMPAWSGGPMCVANGPGTRAMCTMSKVWTRPCIWVTASIPTTGGSTPTPLMPLGAIRSAMAGRSRRGSAIILKRPPTSTGPFSSPSRRRRQPLLMKRVVLHR